MGRALVRDPQVFLFDEPLSNLDAKLRVDMRTEIKRLHQRLKTTIVYVTHDQIEAMTLATRIAVMKDGELQQFGTPAEIYNNPANIFVADFMGSPAMNLIPAKIGRGNGNALAVECSRGERRAGHAAARQRPPASRAYAGREVDPRPAAGGDHRSATAPTATRRASPPLDCLVEVIEPAGSDTFVVTDLGGKEVVARLRADANVAAGPGHAASPST